jgi:hypothetical protein
MGTFIFGSHLSLHFVLLPESTHREGIFQVVCTSVLFREYSRSDRTLLYFFKASS